MSREPLEITDVIVDFDPDTLARRPVRKTAARAKLEEAGASAFALREVDRLPEQGGVLDEAAVDRVILTAHAEMQRLWETMDHGKRVGRVLSRMVHAARATGVSGPIRITDVGCGCGYVVRWLAAHQVFDRDVRLIGVDYNKALIARAQRLARAEELDVELLVANAFELKEPATFYISTGVLHHFRAGGLVQFFKQQAEQGARGFVHFDIRKSWAAPLGAWLFHKAKMRLRVGQYDGYLSAARAHGTEELLAAAREGAPNFVVAEQNKAVAYLPMLRAMHGILGLTPEISGAAGDLS
jgi:SAM-dependent methyltransferase